MPTLPPIAIVLLNWNGADLMRKYLPTLLQETPTTLAEIVVADNGSTDDSLEILASNFPSVRRLPLQQNWGFAEGYNKAIATLPHQYILLLNNDVRVSSGWLQPLYDWMKSHPEVAAVQPSIRADRSPEMFEYAGAMGGFLDILGYPFCRGRIFEIVEKDNGQYGTDPLPIFWASGAAMLTRKEVYEKAGGLDATFFAHQEEVDLAWRWHCMGYQLFVIPESIVYHYGGASLRTGNPRKAYLNFRNNLRMLFKNLPLQHLFWVVPSRLLLDLLAATVFTLQGKSGEGKAVLQAWLHFVQGLPSRSPLLQRRRGYKALYRHSLLIRYHLFGNKTFDQLPH